MPGTPRWCLSIRVSEIPWNLGILGVPTLAERQRGFRACSTKAWSTTLEDTMNAPRLTSPQLPTRLLAMPHKIEYTKLRTLQHLEQCALRRPKKKKKRRETPDIIQTLLKTLTVGAQRHGAPCMMPTRLRTPCRGAQRFGLSPQRHEARSVQPLLRVEWAAVLP